MKTENVEKRKPKGDVKFSLSLNDEQKQAKDLILNHPFTFVHGQAGSGKTLTACIVALDLYFKRIVNKIVVTRPTVGTEDNGFLPGTFQDKLEPWLVPIKDNFRKVYNYPEKLLEMERDGQIEIVSLQHFRGRQFDDAICIVDEYQNTTQEQMKMCIGRLGKNSIMVFCGDDEQIDLKKGAPSAIKLIDKLKGSSSVGIIKLVENHRHPAVKELLNLLNS